MFLFFSLTMSLFFDKQCPLLFHSVFKFEIQISSPVTMWAICLLQHDILQKIMFYFCSLIFAGLVESFWNLPSTDYVVENLPIIIIINIGKILSVENCHSILLLWNLLTNVSIDMLQGFVLTIPNNTHNSSWMCVCSVLNSGHHFCTLLTLRIFLPYNFVIAKELLNFIKHTILISIFNNFSTISQECLLDYIKNKMWVDQHTEPVCDWTLLLNHSHTTIYVRNKTS